MYIIKDVQTTIMGLRIWDDSQLFSPLLPRKEVIHPQLPLRMPCYDFTLITNPTVVPALTRDLRVLSALLVWRAVSTRSENVFTATFWFAITSDSDFMESSCRLQSELRLGFWDWLHLAVWQPFILAIVARVLPRASRAMLIWRHPLLPPRL